jgi:hypothetical protein
VAIGYVVVVLGAIIGGVFAHLLPSEAQVRIDRAHKVAPANRE